MELTQIKYSWLPEANEFLSFSVSALLMMVTLKKLATTGCTLIFTINQSSTEVFGLFDRICLLSNGNTLFFGETLSCLQVKLTCSVSTPLLHSLLYLELVNQSHIALKNLKFDWFLSWVVYFLLCTVLAVQSASLSNFSAASLFSFLTFS